MVEETEGRATVAEGAARQLANATKTRAQWGGIFEAGTSNIAARI